MKYRLMPIAAMILLACSAGCMAHAEYSASAITGRVIDEETQQPLAGVNVLAHWVVHYGLEGGARGDMKILETVTDHDGHYSFPAWGPERVPEHFPADARMQSMDPHIIFFKSGYPGRSVANDPATHYAFSGPSHRTSQWNGKTISLRKFIGPIEQYQARFDALFRVDWGDCLWQSMPRMLVALNEENRRLRKLVDPSKTYFTSIPSMAQLVETARGRPCSDVKGFFEEYTR